MRLVVSWFIPDSVLTLTNRFNILRFQSSVCVAVFAYQNILKEPETQRSRVLKWLTGPGSPRMWSVRFPRQTVDMLNNSLALNNIIKWQKTNPLSFLLCVSCKWRFILTLKFSSTVKEAFCGKNTKYFNKNNDLCGWTRDSFIKST